MGPRTRGGGCPPRQALRAAPGFAGREPRRLPPHDCRMAAGFHRVLLQLPRQCARDRRSGEGCQTQFATFLHLRWCSFTANAIVEHGEGAIDCVLKGEGEASIVKLLEAVAGDRGAIAKVPGAVTSDGEGPRPAFVEHLDDIRPARDLVRKRHKYFIGVLDPCASIEFSRGCPWDCSFCSAWTFYGRSYRLLSPERVIEDLASIRERGVFIVDDVAFIQQRHGFAIGEAIARKGIRKNFY